jgi:outer membrane autotransporter protein
MWPANYTGIAGSGITLNTFLGADNSPSDRLIINGGSATGMTGLTIHNSGGPGAETTSNGIPVVVTANGGTTVPGAFALAGELRAGAFDYDLFRGGLSGNAPNDWFLRSSFMVIPPTPVPPVEPVAPVEPVEPAPPFPVDPPPNPLPPGVLFPIIGPELATDGVVQPVARQMGFTMLGTLHERIGDTLTEENAGPDAEGWGRSGWARFFGQQIDNQYKAFANPSVNGRLLGVQAGFDLWRGSFIPGHRDAAGLYFAYGNSAMDVNGFITNATGTGYLFTRTGTLNLYAYSGGAYWTHYGPGGWYLDAVVQGTAYTGNATTQFANLPTDGSGIITSLEAGYPIPLPLGPRFILEPQGQILWQHTSFGQANDGLGEVALGTTSGATGRLGVRGQWTIASDNGLVWQPYARANLWQNWGGKATTTFGVDQVPLLQQSTQLEFAAGLTTKVNSCLSFYVQAGYEFAIGGDTDGGRRQGAKGDFGVRLTFGHPPPPPPPVAVPAAAAAARTYLVFFDWDKATLTDRARQIIREAADNSTHVQYTRIAVNGYTDTSGTPRYNQGLSVRRAEAVAAELVRDGVPRNVIAIEGFGETHLLVPTGPGVREPQNRRVEIVMQ